VFLLGVESESQLVCPITCRRDLDGGGRIGPARDRQRDQLVQLGEACLACRLVPASGPTFPSWMGRSGRSWTGVSVWDQAAQSFS